MTQCPFPNFSELQLRVDGVNATRRHRDAGRQSRSAQVATLTITGGAKPGNYSKKQHRDWEVSVLKIQMALEDNFRDIAEKCSLPEGRHAVLLMDRGAMDVLAYVGADSVCFSKRFRTSSSCRWRQCDSPSP